MAIELDLLKQIPLAEYGIKVSSAQPTFLLRLPPKNVRFKTVSEKREMSLFFHRMVASNPQTPYRAESGSLPEQYIGVFNLCVKTFKETFPDENSESFQQWLSACALSCYLITSDETNNGQLFSLCSYYAFDLLLHNLEKEQDIQPDVPKIQKEIIAIKKKVFSFALQLDSSITKAELETTVDNLETIIFGAETNIVRENKEFSETLNKIASTDGHILYACAVASIANFVSINSRAATQEEVGQSIRQLVGAYINLSRLEVPPSEEHIANPTNRTYLSRALVLLRDTLSSFRTSHVFNFALNELLTATKVGEYGHLFYILTHHNWLSNLSPELYKLWISQHDSGSNLKPQETDNYISLETSFKGVRETLARLIYSDPYLLEMIKFVSSKYIEKYQKRGYVISFHEPDNPTYQNNWYLRSDTLLYNLNELFALTETIPLLLDPLLHAAVSTIKKRISNLLQSPAIKDLARARITVGEKRVGEIVEELMKIKKERKDVAINVLFAKTTSTGTTDVRVVEFEPGQIEDMNKWSQRSDSETCYFCTIQCHGKANIGHNLGPVFFEIQITPHNIANVNLMSRANFSEIK